MRSNETAAQQPLAWLTADLPGVGGAIKRFDEDFLVEELPRYEASGEGTHTYFAIEKRGLTTLAAVGLIARSLGKQPRDIGYAGLKDAHGITRQMLSVEHVDPRRVQSLDLNRLKVLSVDRHTNKIKLGHLAGNRFTINVRDITSSPQQAASWTPDEVLKQANPILERLIARGVPNYFGPQRFGVRGDNARVGLSVLRNDYKEAIALILGRPAEIDRPDVRRARALFDTGDLPAAVEAWPGAFGQQKRILRALIEGEGDAGKAWRAVDHTLRKLYVSAFQSELFNRVVGGRIDTIDTLYGGDIAYKHRNGACFRVQDAAVEQPRCDAFEISPTGPLFGRKMVEPEGIPGELETRVLSESNLTREQIRAKDGSKLDGTRRPLRVPLGKPTIDVGEDDRGPYLRLSFTLPPGSYATAVTREICKAPRRPAP